MPNNTDHFLDKFESQIEKQLELYKQSESQTNKAMLAEAIGNGLQHRINRFIKLTQKEALQEALAELYEINAYIKRARLDAGVEVMVELENAAVVSGVSEKTLSNLYFTLKSFSKRYTREFTTQVEHKYPVASETAVIREYIQGIHKGFVELLPQKEGGLTLVAFSKDSNEGVMGFQWGFALLKHIRSLDTRSDKREYHSMGFRKPLVKAVNKTVFFKQKVDECLIFTMSELARLKELILSASASYREIKGDRADTHLFNTTGVLITRINEELRKPNANEKEEVEQNWSERVNRSIRIPAACLLRELKREIKKEKQSAEEISTQIQSV